MGGEIFEIGKTNGWALVAVIPQAFDGFLEVIFVGEGVGVGDSRVVDMIEMMVVDGNLAFWHTFKKLVTRNY